MLVKTLVGGLAAKVAFGMGVAAASVTAAGAAGVLPDPAQHAVASVVSAATPFAVPDPATVTLDVSGDTEKSKSKADSKAKAKPAVTDDDEAGDDEGGTRTLNHGSCVSTVAKNKAESGSHGKTVSSVARSDCGKTDPAPSSTTSTTIAGGSTTSSTTVAAANSNRGNSGSSGNGNSSGKSAKSGKG